MSCPCDQVEFPTELYIPAGLSSLPRQIATFPEFRAALLHDLGGYAALAKWRGRQKEDFGVMLLEMWAYVCDVTSFYDEVIAHESYLRTAQQRASLRKLIQLLGYVPRPAVAASVSLAAFASGRKVVKLPAGTAFRSGAFKGKPPQVFELTSNSVIHPFSNEWKLLPVRPSTFGKSDSSPKSLLCKAGTVSAKVDDLVLVKAGTALSPAVVTAASDHTGADGEKYTKVQFDRSVTIPANTALSSVRLLKPASRAPITVLADTVATESKAYSSSPPYVCLDAIYRSIRTGQIVILEYGHQYYARSVTGVSEISRTVTAQYTLNGLTMPAVTVTLTKLTLDSAIEKSSTSGQIRVTTRTVDDSEKMSLARQEFGGLSQTELAIYKPPTSEKAAPTLVPRTSSYPMDFTVHFELSSAGTVTMEALTSLDSADSLMIQTPIESPNDANPPSKFQLEDKNEDGVTVGASLVYATGELQLDPGTQWSSPGLVPPVRVFGNIIAATRGESVSAESLGTGDASEPNQTFELKKSPLTYLSAPTADNASGVASTLSVYVDGVRWKEVASFYGQSSSAEVYIVRQNDEEESRVIFGDGKLGRRLPTGASVTAYYRHGAGAAMPPAGSINQLAKPLTGLRGVRNPVGAAGGANAEPADELQKYAPRSALLLGRAVSLADLEAATAAVSGVRAVRAEWHWNHQRLRPGAQIYYIGDSGLDATITQRLRGLSEEDTPIDVVPATGLPKTLSVQLQIDPRYLEAKVVAAVRAALVDTDTGLLAPERVGIGLPLFRSRIYEFILRTSGASSVTGLLLDNADFGKWAVSPGAGNYFDFENGSVLLNGN